MSQNPIPNKGYIFAGELRAVLRLWHSYHAKYKIPYNHDEAQRMFNSLLMIFKEG